ncbi:MAG: hypothetical protein JSS49_20915 [Planctomycetes bacterium]|nr:hypothetical protein [Planctomycetota bacterium]
MDATTWFTADIGEVMEAAIDTGQGIQEFAFDLVFWTTNTIAATVPLFVLVLLITSLGRRGLAPWARCALWTLVLIRMILPISLTSPVSAQIAWPLAAHAIADKPLPTLTIEQLATSDVSPPTVFPPSRRAHSFIDWLDWVSTTTLVQSVQALFVAATMLFAVATLISFHRLVGWLRFGEKLSDPTCLRLIEEARRQFGIRASIRVLKVHELEHPAVFDGFCPWILLPETFTSLSTAQQRCAVWHCLATIRRGDSVASLLASVVRVLQWWNPLFWWTHRAWQTERLLACDNLVIERMNPDALQDYFQYLSISHYPSRGHWQTLWIDPPGLVTSATCPSITSRRTTILNLAMTSESRWRYWASWCLIGILAGIGLTDPAPVSLKDLPIQLPSGTTWEEAPTDPEDGTEYEQREYDIARCVSRLQSDDPAATEDTIARLVRQFISLQHRERSPQVPADAGPVWIEDGKLIVRTTEKRHARIARLIQDWELRSRRSVCIETRWLSTEIELRDLLPSQGGFLVNSQIVPGSPSQQTVPVSGIATTSIVQRPLPVFVRLLTDSEFVEFANRIIGNRRISLFIPKVTASEGEIAKISTGAIRPFVTGYHREENGVITPLVSSPQDGFGLEFLALTDSDRIQMRIVCHSTRIDDVLQRKLKSPTMDVKIQVPSIRSEVITANVTLGPDESLLLVPLVRDDNGQLNMQVISPRVIEPDE